MFKILDKIFGDPNEKALKKIKPIVNKINSLESKVQSFSDEQLKNKTTEFKSRIEKGEALDQILPEAFAVVRETAKRVLGQRHFDVQLIGGIVLHQGKLAEMKTGEGKTLVSTLPVYLNAISGKGVHIVTVNDYLAKRDANWMGPIYHFLGISVGVIQHDKSFVFDPKTDPDDNEVTVEMENLREVTRKDAYLSDVTFGTNNEFGFDYLRDNMAVSKKTIVQRELNYAIVDEVDSILIDEARTPLIISAPDTESNVMYQTFSRIVPVLQKEKDYTVDEKMKAVSLTDEGIEKVERIIGTKDIYDEKRIELVHHLEQALKAEILFKRDKDYVVKDGEVIIVDEFTGRLMPGRRFSEGLHQAIEAKENVKVQKESRTLATITFQNYFRLYKKLSGMTGTAATNAEEFSKVYDLDVVIVPTNKQMIRKDFNDLVYKTEKGKFKALIREIKKRNKKGQPVLVGTISIEKSEIISDMLKKENIKHEVLNAKFHEREALIISRAGQKGAVTIATNMAGRGTDIKLGDGVEKLGGLCIFGTERHEARRIDNQLRGRSGRQGEPGETQFFVSMEDNLMRVFGSDKVKSMMDKLGIEEDMPIENSFISKSIENAQGKIEGYNFDIRKHVLEYDDVMNKQREAIYRRRREILDITEEMENDNKEINKENFPELSKLKDKILEMFENQIRYVVSIHSTENRSEWDIDGMLDSIKKMTPIGVEINIKEKLKNIVNSGNSDEQARSLLTDLIFETVSEIYNKREEKIGFAASRQIEKMIILRSIDILWMEHLESMNRLKEGIGLRGYGQKDPLVEYKKERYRMFQSLLFAIEENVTSSIAKIQIKTSPSQIEHKNVIERGSEGSIDKTTPTKRKKIGRNDPCPCGKVKSNGKPVKYKKCCGK